MKVQPLDLAVVEAVQAGFWARARPRRKSRDAFRQVSHNSAVSVGPWMFVSIAVVSARIVETSIAPDFTAS